MSDDGWCARCGQYPAVRGTDFCRLHGGHAPRPRETTPPEQPSYCTYRPLPGEVLKSACPDCGRAVALHIGVEHCPVCELVQRNRQAAADVAEFRRLLDPRVREQEARRAALRNPLAYTQYKR